MEIFIIGLLFGCVILPILDSFTSLAISFFEMIKSYLNTIIIKNNQKVSISDSPKQAIGFAYREEVEEDHDI